MKFKIKGYLAAFCLMAGTSYGASTLQISNPFAGSIASGFANAAGVPTNGMQWGIIVDTTGNGFSGLGSSYDSMALGSTTNAFMSFGGLATDDYFVSSGSVTADSSAALESNFTQAGGNGTIGNIAVNYLNGISQGDSFALIWFSSNSAADGARYGFLNIGQVMPADNLPAVDMSSPFAGADPARPASNTFGAVAIPEPSRLILLGLGFAGLIWRRKR